MYFQLAQVPSPQSAELGSLVLGIAILLIIVEQVKSIFFPSKPSSEELVKRVELNELKAQLANYVTRVELQRIEQQIANMMTEYKELSRSTASRSDELNKSIIDLRLNQEAMRREFTTEINEASTTILDKIDAINRQNMELLNALLTNKEVKNKIQEALREN
jgi:hypothetical protein